MATFCEKGYLAGTADYKRGFWDAMRGSGIAADAIRGGVDTATGGYALPKGTEGRLAEAIADEHRAGCFVRVETT